MRLTKIAVCTLFSVAAMNSIADEFKFVDQRDPQLVKDIHSHMITASSRDAMEKIPLADIYNFIFRYMISQPELFKTMTVSDQALILSLPTHHSKTFAEESMARFDSVCADVMRNISDIEAVEMAEKVTSAESQEYKTLEDHYIQVLSNISEQGLKVIEGIYESTEGTNRIAHSRVDYVGLSEVQPQYVKSKYVNFCENLESRRYQLTDETFGDLIKPKSLNSEG